MVGLSDFSSRLSLAPVHDPQLRRHAGTLWSQLSATQFSREQSPCPGRHPGHSGTGGTETAARRRGPDHD